MLYVLEITYKTYSVTAIKRGEIRLAADTDILQFIIQAVLFCAMMGGGALLVGLGVLGLGAGVLGALFSGGFFILSILLLLGL